MTGWLIFIGLILIILNVMAIKKQNKSFDGVLGNAIGNINDYDIKLGEIRREFSESILDLQSEIMHIRETMERNVDIAEVTEEIYDDNTNETVIDDFYSSEGNDISMDTDTNTNTSNGNTEKVQEIKRLYSEGLSAQEISEKMQLGKGEVLLIIDLYIR